MCRDAMPIELWILVREIGGRGVAELPIHSDLFELIVQRVGLAQIVRIAELSDEIGSPNKQALLVVHSVRVSSGGNRVHSMARVILLASRSLLSPIRSITNNLDLSRR